MQFPSSISGSQWNVAIRDPVWKHVWITPELRDITLTAEFSRLYRIKQLGPAEYVYPGATHSRAAHSFGVFHMAHRMLSVLLENGAREWTTDTGCASFLIAALLHDLGHFPFTHALKELPLLDHEALTATLIRTEPLRSLIGKAGGDPDMTAAIIDGATTKNEETAFFSRILSGVLDPDKLDYLNRDAYFCGVPYGIQDTDFIFSHILPHRERGIMLTSRAIMSVESVLFSKYLMYRSVYWHRTIRVATAMMKKYLFSALSRSNFQPEDLYSCDDNGIFELVTRNSIPERVLPEALRNRNFYTIVFSIPFSEVGGSKLESLTARSDTETRLADFFSIQTGKRIESFHVLIDIPERISFESDLFIEDEQKTFSESSTVFTHSVVQNFVTSLRKIRVAVHPDYASAVLKIPSLSQQLANWMGLEYTDIR